jgi:hypothetical protein
MDAVGAGKTLVGRDKSLVSANERQRGSFEHGEYVPERGDALTHQGAIDN